jgi:hypothetical protein
MATLPKWQEPLAGRADRAEQTLRATLLAPGGGAGALAAAAAANTDLAELCAQVADRTASPLLKLLLSHGGRALAAEAQFLMDAARDDLAEVGTPVTVVPASADSAAGDGPVDEDQALVAPAPELPVSSGDAVANEPVAEQPQASLDEVDERQAVPVDEPPDDTVAHEPVADAVGAAAEMRLLNTTYAETRARYRAALQAAPLVIPPVPDAARAAADLLVVLHRARDSGLFTGLALWAIEDATELYERAAAGAP